MRKLFASSLVTWRDHERWLCEKPWIKRISAPLGLPHSCADHHTVWCLDCEWPEFRCGGLRLSHRSRRYHRIRRATIIKAPSTRPALRIIALKGFSQRPQIFQRAVPVVSI
jgi:hypothetical protein